MQGWRKIGGVKMEKDAMVVVNRHGEVRPLATEIVALLKNKNVTYREALIALEDAQSFLERASLENQL